MPEEVKELRKDGQGNTHEVNVVYTDLKGNKWYGFTKPLQMPAQRAISAGLAAEWANLNMTKEDLRAYVARMKEHGNKGNIVDLFKTLGYIEERMEWAADGRTLLELAKCYFMVGDEPVDGNTETHDRLKEKIWNEDPACRAFFLHWAFVFTKGYSTFSAHDTRDYFKAQETLLKLKQGSTQSAAPRSASNPSRKSFMKGVRTSIRKPS